MTEVRQPRLYIFDADGTLRWTTVPGQKYPLTSAQWRLMPNVRDRLSAVEWTPDGPWLAVASNQCGVGEGRITRGLACSLIEDAIVAALGRIPQPCRIAMCCCKEGAPCPRQKPAPGLLLDLLSQFGVAPADALYIGDLPIDAEAARRAGVPFLHAAEFFGWGRAPPATELPVSPCSEPLR